jgi:hypothetical protein
MRLEQRKLIPDGSTSRQPGGIRARHAGLEVVPVQYVTDGIPLALDDDVCAAFARRFSSPVTEWECRAYARGYYTRTFPEIAREHTPEEISRAVMDGMRRDLGMA